MVDVPLRHRPKPTDTASAPRLRPGRRTPRFLLSPITLMAVALVAAVVLVAGVKMAIDSWQSSASLSEPTTDPTPVDIAIAGERLTIPANMIRSGKARNGGPMERVDLAIQWPTMSGYTDELASDFRRGPPAAPILYASLGARDGPVDATGRLDAVYARFFEGTAVAGPAGLVGRRLSADSGYAGEIIFFDPGSEAPFVARCPVDTMPDMAATCLRDVNVGKGLSLLYRFDKSLLGDWRIIDDAITKLAAGLVAP